MALSKAISKQTLALTVVAAAAVAAAPASAQFHDRNRNISVRERPQPGYDPIGIPVGAFRAYLTLPIGVVYNNNILAEEDGEEKEDIIVTARPRAELRSQWSSHELRFTADVESLSYQDFGDEDRTNVNLAANGRLDIDGSASVGGYVSQSWLEEARTEASAPINTVEPVRYDVSRVGADASKELNRLRLSAGASAYDADYDDAIGIGGQPVDQDNRDHTSITALGRVDYAVTPATALFGSISGSERSYDVQPSDDPLNAPVSRDAEGVRLLAGASFDITNLVRGEVSVGALREDFADPAVEDVDGLAAYARVEWFPSPLATFELAAERSVTETGVFGAAGALTTTLSARVDYEVKRNVILTGQVSHRSDEFEGIVRDDDALAAAVDLLYLMNEHVGASITVAHAQRDSSGGQAGIDFSQERVALNLILRY